MSIDVQCKKKSSDTEFAQLFTIITDPATLGVRVEISGNFTVFLKVNELDFNIHNITKSDIGVLKVDFIAKEMIKLFNGAIKTAINVMFAFGINVGWILDKLGITFMSLKRSELIPYDGYFTLFMTP